MSSSDSSAGGNVATGPELEAVFREADALQSALAAARRTRLLLMLVLIAFLVVVCWAFYRLGNEVLSAEYQQRLLQTAEKRLNEKQDHYLRHVQQLVENTSPVLTQAFYDQTKKDMPAYLRGVEKERDKLAQNLQAKLEKRLETHYAELLHRHEKLFQEEFPLIKDEELHQRMVANTEVAVNHLMKKYYLDEMNSQINSLFEGWDQFPLADPPAPNDPPLQEQFIGYLLALLEYRLTHGKTTAQP